MVISTCQRVYNLTTSEFFGVTCVDTVLKDLLGDIDAFIYGEHSYAFIIDASGRTLIHPWLPKVYQAVDSSDLCHLIKHIKNVTNGKSNMYSRKNLEKCINVSGNSLYRPVLCSGHLSLAAISL